MAVAHDVQPLIMVVEDNDLITEFVVAHLRQAGFRTVCASSGQQALKLLERVHPALIVLDVVMEDLDGYEVCRRIRARELAAPPTVAAIPILMLTARADEADRLDGFYAGADDYLTKPFNPEELVARIRAILRRAQGMPHPPVQVGRLTIDPLRREAHANGTPLSLSPKEFEVLYLLARYSGQVVSRAQLIQQVWGHNDASSRTIDVHVQRLREKLEALGDTQARIQTERGLGYKMVA